MVELNGINELRCLIICVPLAVLPTCPIWLANGICFVIICIVVFLRNSLKNSTFRVFGYVVVHGSVVYRHRGDCIAMYADVGILYDCGISWQRIQNVFDFWSPLQVNSVRDYTRVDTINMGLGTNKFCIQTRALHVHASFYNILRMSTTVFSSKYILSVIRMCRNDIMQLAETKDFCIIGILQMRFISMCPRHSNKGIWRMLYLVYHTNFGKNFPSETRTTRFANANGSAKYAPGVYFNVVVI